MELLRSHASKKGLRAIIVGLENLCQPRVGRRLIAQDHAEGRCVGFAAVSIAIGEHRAEQMIEAEVPSVGRKSLDRRGRSSSPVLLELHSLADSVKVHGREIVESIVAKELLVTTSFEHASKQDVHEATCDEEILVLVASMCRSGGYRTS